MFNTTPALVPNALFTPKEAADYLRVPDRTLERWRHTGDGPVFLKLGRRVVYRGDDLQAWIGARRREHTSASVPPAAPRW